MSEAKRIQKQSRVKAQALVERMLQGEVIRPDDIYDRQELARLVDTARSRLFVPIVTMTGEVTTYRMSQPDIYEYLTNREVQRSRLERVIRNAEMVRDAKRAKRLFAELGLTLPDAVMVLLHQDARRNAPADNAAPVVMLDKGEADNAA